MEQASLEDRVAALERHHSEHATWHSWDQKSRKLTPAFAYREGESFVNAIRFAGFGLCRFAWFLARCAVVYEFGRVVISFVNRAIPR